MWISLVWISGKNINGGFGTLAQGSTVYHEQKLLRYKFDLQLPVPELTDMKGPLFFYCLCQKQREYKQTSGKYRVQSTRL